MDNRDVQGASIKRGPQTVVEGSILVMMIARRVDFATVRSEFDSISFQVGCETAARFMLGVYSLRNLFFLTGSRHIPC